MWLVDPDNVLTESVSDGLVIVNLPAGRRYVLHGVAATIWEGILCGHSVDCIMDDVRRFHAGVPDDAETPVRGFIAAVVDAGLAQPCGGPASVSDPRVPSAGAVTSWAPPRLELLTGVVE